MATIELNIDPSKSTEPLRELSDILDQVNGKTDETKKSFNSAFGSSSDAVDNSTKAIEKNTKAQQKNEKELDDLKKGVVDFDRKSKASFDDAPVDEYTKSIKQAEKATDNLDRSTDDLGDKSQGVFSGLSDGLGEIGDGFSGIGEGIVSGQGGGGIVGGLQGVLTKLGPIGLAVGAVVGGVAAIGSEVIQLDKEFDELRGRVEQLFDGTADQIDRIVVNVKAIAETFDEDVNEVLLATNTLSKEFGISAEEATSLLERGFNSAANAQGDLVDSVKEFSSQVRASGGDAEDLFSILEKSNKEGIFSDKGIDVVKEFGLRIREQAKGTQDALSGAFGADFTEDLLKGVDEGSISSIEALQLVSEQLGTLEENSAEAQTVIADVFGGAGEDAGFRFLTLLKDINTEQGFGNELLTEEQKRKQETLDANKRLAAAQNELSKAIGDSSVIGRVWIDIQTFFIETLTDIVGWIDRVVGAFEIMSDDPVEGLKQLGMAIFDLVAVPTNFLIDITNEAIEALLGYEDAIPNLGFGAEEVRNYTDAQEAQIEVSRIAQTAIRNYGAETAVATGKVNKYFNALIKGNITEEKRVQLANQLSEQYKEQVGDLDLLTASEEELLRLKNEIIAAEYEQTIAQGRALALRQINLEIQLRQAELERGVSDARRKQLEDEIQFLEENAKAKVDLVEQETRVRLGLEEAVNDEILADTELTEEEKAKLAAEGSKKRQKIADDFNKVIQEILKRGEQAFLNESTAAQEERLRRQRDFQRNQLRELLEQARTLQEQLTGSRELDQDVIDAFNLAEEKIEIEFQDKIAEIKRKAREKERAEEIAFQRELLAFKQGQFDQEIAFLQSREAEEIALIEQSRKRAGEKERDFERRKQLDILDVQEFYLQQRIDLIQQEQALKLNAIQVELDAIADKEGEEYELKRINLERKKKLIEQETLTEKAQLDLQLQNIQDNIEELNNIKGPTLGDVFGDIQNKLAESLNLSPEQLQAITSAVRQVATEIFNTIQSVTQEQLDANDELISKLEEREEDVKESLDREIEFAQAGYAANVEAKREELELIQQAQEEAVQEREALLERQNQLDTISQTVSLITAAANLYKTLSPLPFGIGIGIATALTGVMFGAFISAKAKAQNITSLEKGGKGDRTGIIKGKRHQHGGERFLDHVEVEKDEMWSVYNRKGSRKHRKLIEKFTDAVNNDSINSLFPNLDAPQIIIEKKNKLTSQEIEFQASVVSRDLERGIASLPEIKNMLKSHFAKPKRFLTEHNGHTYLVEVFPNGSKKKTKMKFNA